ncbi:hypothetical protein TNCT_630921 [Trichonephila clavata]|uniref:Secreted protein n=1 Tax=Trichonephila clavata TaxID=2740835 RepID=A0A8X6GDR9_TRICU|nr:hypothetical protein TNCT_630921 [Trichonephila clavata]
MSLHLSRVLGVPLRMWVLACFTCRASYVRPAPQLCDTPKTACTIRAQVTPNYSNDVLDEGNPCLKMTPCPDLLHCALGRALRTKTVPRPPG